MPSTVARLAILRDRYLTELENASVAPTYTNDGLRLENNEFRLKLVQTIRELQAELREMRCEV